MIYKRKMAFQVLLWWLKRKRMRRENKQKAQRILNADHRPPRTKKSRQSKSKPIDRNKFIESVWWKMLQNKEQLNDPHSKQAKQFRVRFRFPYPLYLRLLDCCRDHHMFSDSTHNCAGSPAVPLELKILGVLRVLGRGNCFDDIAELTGSGFQGDVHRRFFHDFCKLFSEHYSPIYIKPADTIDAIDKVTRVYERMGLPGCLGSVDCTHIPWDRCPAQQHSMYTGKEGFPSVAYEVACEHTHRIISVTSGHYGSRTDMTIVRFDGFVSSVRKDPMYTRYRYKMEDNEGREYWHRGLYLLADNGYHRWRVLMPPIKESSVPDEISYSEWVESVRKEIECTFGLLKKRFRFLKNPFLLQKQYEIDNMFRTCCILHNMLLEYDELDYKWDAVIDYTKDVIDEEESAVMLRYNERVNSALSALHETHPGSFEFGMSQFAGNVDVAHCAATEDVEEEFEPGFFEQRSKLIVNYNKKKLKGEVEWL
jgi:hypothetical protein